MKTLLIPLLSLLVNFATPHSRAEGGMTREEYERMQLMQMQAEAAAREEEFKNPKKPEIEKGRAVRGSKNAPIMIVVYSDFQCPYCSRGANTVEEVVKKYGKKVAVLFKHLPMPFHSLAMPAAKRFEAIAKQSADKAYAFHDEVFKNQKQFVAEGEAYLDTAAKKIGANVDKMKKDMESDAVKNQIAKDTAEAGKFGFNGTPGFLISGVSLKGAYPLENFVEIIEKRLQRKS